ncbi:hypothetical protein JW926_02275 [Candidatus Sumerlaeota bacterium]|nr:hypothetical protein [Candidatus Sumerlaeota bacterium]
MKMGILTVMILTFFMVDSTQGKDKASSKWEGKKIPEFNQIVLETIKQYPVDGTHGYWWPKEGEGNYDGGTEDVFFEGKQVMKGEEKKRTYCCGLTLEAFLKSYKKWLEKRGGEKASVVSPDQWARFKKLWFVEKLNGPGPSAALEEFGLGKTIEPDEAIPGDFIQIWRTVPEGKKSPSGHSVIFIDWERNAAGRISGIRYWSTQPGTNGIHERVETLGSDGGINGEFTYFARVEPKANKVKEETKTKTESKPKEEKSEKKKEKIK